MIKNFVIAILSMVILAMAIIWHSRESEWEDAVRDMGKTCVQRMEQVSDFKDSVYEPLLRDCRLECGVNFADMRREFDSLLKVCPELRRYDGPLRAPTSAPTGEVGSVD